MARSRLAWILADVAVVAAMALAMATVRASPARPEPRTIAYWDWVRRGANCQNRRMTPEFWMAVEAGEDAEKLQKRGPNPLWDVLVKALSRRR